MYMGVKIAVTRATLESDLHEVNAIRTGQKLYSGGHVEFELREDDVYWAQVNDRGSIRGGVLTFTRDGTDVDEFSCNCRIGSDGKCLCKHIVAAILAIQGGMIESKVTLSKSASVSSTVSQANTAKAIGSGALDVYATPSMIALMEEAACKCLEDGLDDGQTSVGAEMNVSHTAASPIGVVITATATIEYVFGRKIEFAVTASDAAGEIGKGKHTRVLVDSEKFMNRTNARGGPHHE
ncbi:hypothetical protein FACS1894184_06180 [Clostridia bacterium]|nr:hypothetical protein FACS1894184_06180 [Clostridia bacterium]